MIRDDSGKWTSSHRFKESGEKYLKYGYYTNAPWGSLDWLTFWKEERKRCLKGLTIDGESITGDHYFYLNYCRIEKVDQKSVVGKKANKIQSFPDFWDGDYDYFWCRKIAKEGILGAINMSVKHQREIFNLPEEKKLKVYTQAVEKLRLKVKPVLTIDNLEGGKDLIIGKSRRRGFSYKNASIAANNYFHRPFKYTLLMAYEKKYLFPGIKTIFGKVLSYINFVNDNTGWLMPSDYSDTQNLIKSTYKEYKDGKGIEKGFNSSVEAISFKDNPDAGRGSDTYDTIGEEVGAWGVPGGLKATIAAMRSSAEAGGFKTGMMTLFGTSGDVLGGTADFADLFSRPGANNFMEFYDIYGEYSTKIEGFFFPAQLNKEGFYDENGNSNLTAAKEKELETRKKLIEKGATSTEILKRMQEEPLNSAEAFSMIAINNFPVVQLKRQLDKVKANKWQFKKGFKTLFKSEGGETVLDLSGAYKREAIVSLSNVPIDKRGCPIIYEVPIENAPTGLYKIGYDPVRHDLGSSLAAIIVYKCVHVGSYHHNIIVAEYIGRLETTEDIDALAVQFAEYYNTTIMYENEIPAFKNYLRRRKKLHLLALQPDAVISKNIKKSKVARVYGCHMNASLKDTGERYVKDWLLEELDFDENGDPVTVIDKIYSIRLLEELINYNRKGNFDLVSALFMCLFQVQESTLEKTYGKDKNQTKLENMLKFMKTMYR